MRKAIITVSVLALLFFALAVTARFFSPAFQVESYARRTAHEPKGTFDISINDLFFDLTPYLAAQEPMPPSMLKALAHILSDRRTPAVRSKSLDTILGT